MYIMLLHLHQNEYHVSSELCSTTKLKWATCNVHTDPAGLCRLGLNLFFISQKLQALKRPNMGSSLSDRNPIELTGIFRIVFSIFPTGWLQDKHDSDY